MLQQAENDGCFEHWGIVALGKPNCSGGLQKEQKGIRARKVIVRLIQTWLGMRDLGVGTFSVEMVSSRKRVSEITMIDRLVVL